ncbi:MAG: hypothetical protein HN725_03790 [Alphaproteobacteria bacterium]|jgi:hypothetical protein|nr:hypothetical protein [Alphaproteobacteria bacterium]MBT4083784.1 hypothetical protein [Alphaproteobacteria bacterium]MBT4542264.1 hypothetical protein [Alphaproteobacteria bacterium]MBT7744387.1 hypothetical protein [Alphaproteobacteria bacterium]
MAIDDELTKNTRFLKELEHNIRVTNNRVIHQKVEPITAERMLSFADAVANLRAEYVQEAFVFADMEQGDGSGAADIDKLDTCRRRFEVARDAFIALQRAIELGYVTVNVE